MKKGVRRGHKILDILIFILTIFLILGIMLLFMTNFVKNEFINPNTSYASEKSSYEQVETQQNITEHIQESQSISETDLVTSDNASEVSEPAETIDTSETNTPEETSDATENNTTEETLDTTKTHEPVGTIYLTFDDGPSTEITSKILDILEEKNVQATFFIVDYSEEKLPIINREIANGHTVGLHGSSHDYSVVYSSPEATINSFVTLQQKLYDDTGYYSTIIRFPGGSSNTVSKKYYIGIMSEVTQSVTNMGFTYFDWNVDSSDAGGANSAEEIYTNVTSALVEGRTNVVLMHDASNKTCTLEALSSIIDYGISHGFEFKAIDQNTTPIHHSISN